MSDKSISQKLALKPGQRFLLLNAPGTYRQSIDALPKGVKLSTKIGDKADVIQIFASTWNELKGSFRTESHAGPQWHHLGHLPQGDVETQG